MLAFGKQCRRSSALCTWLVGAESCATDSRQSIRYAPSARRVCGAAVVKLSVYVDVHPHGQVCSACDVHAFVVRYRAGRYRVWEAY